jgi:hypothetical protein
MKELNLRGNSNMFIRKKKYEDLLDKLDEVKRDRDMYARQIETIKALKKSHNPGPTCKGCKNLIEEIRIGDNLYHCKLDRGCKDYTEE